MASTADPKNLTPVVYDKEGFLYLHQKDKKSLKKFYCIAYDNKFVYKSNLKDEYPEETLNVLGAVVKILGTRLKKRYGIEILLGEASGVANKPEKNQYDFYADTEEEAQEWFSIITRCTLPSDFPKNPYFSNTPEEQQILTVLPKLKGIPLAASFDLVSFRHSGAHAPCSSVEEAPHLCLEIRHERAPIPQPEGNEAIGSRRTCRCLR